LAEMGSIEFEIKGNASNAAKSLDSLAESLTKLKSATGGGLGLSAISKEIKELSDAAAGVGDLKTFASGLKELGKVKISATLSKSMQSLTDALSSLDVAKLNDFSSALKNLGDFKVSSAALTNFATGIMTISGAAENLSPQAIENLERFTTALGRLSGVDLSGVGNAMRAVRGGGAQVTTPLSGKVQDAIRNGDKLDILRMKAEQLRNALESAFGKGDLKGALSLRQQIIGVEEQIRKLEEEAGKAPSLLKRLGNIGKSVFGALGSVGKKALGGLGSLLAYPFKKAASGITRFAAGIKSITSGLGRIAMYRLFRYVIKQITEAFQEGVKHAYEWSRVVGGPVSSSGMTFAQSMNDIATSMRYFKNSIGAAVAPLIGALTPAIRVVTDAAIQCINVINQLIALLSGASGWTKAIRKAEEYGDAVGGAGGAAKKALEYLAPFDELNVLPDPKSGGGGSALGDISGEFEEMESFADGIKDFASRIREAFLNSDWQGLGTILGEKVNEVVENIPWGDMGAKVGNYIGGFFSTQYWTLKTTDFQTLGGKIAEFINNALEQINFSDIGGLLAQKMTLVWEMIIGGINNLDFGLVGTSIGDFFRGFVDDLTETIGSVDWGATAENLVGGLIDAIKGLDIGEVVNSLLRFMGTVISAVAQGIGTLLIDIAEILVNPNTWVLVEAWLKDLPAKIKQIGINIVNGFVAPIVNGLNNLIDQINEKLGKNIPHIEFQLIPDIPQSELTKNYDEAKRQLEAKSRRSPVAIRGRFQDMSLDTQGGTFGLTDSERTVGLTGRIDRVSKSVGTVGITAVANLTGVKDFIPADKKSVNVNGNIVSATDKLSAAQKSVSLSGKITSATDSIPSSQKTISINGKFTSATDGLTSDKKTVNTTAKFTSSTDAMPTPSRTFTAKANFTTYANGLGTPSIGSKAQIKSYGVDSTLQDSGYLKVSSKLNIVGQTNVPTVKANLQYSNQTKALGGVFSNGSWRSIPQYASGGRPHGSLFLAGEAGAEIVGHLGGRTEVLNRSQIASAIYSAVKSAMVGASIRTDSYENTYDDSTNEEMIYRAMSRALSEYDNVIELDGDVVYRKMVQRNRLNTRATGVNAMA